MDVSKILISDPKTKEPSVSLTMLLVSFVAALVACGLEMAELTKSTSGITEIMYSMVALYFGRRFSVGSKSFSSENTNQVKE